MYSCKNEGRKAFFGSTELKFINRGNFTGSDCFISLIYQMCSDFQVKLWYNVFCEYAYYKKSYSIL